MIGPISRHGFVQLFREIELDVLGDLQEQQDHVPHVRMEVRAFTDLRLEIFRLRLKVRRNSQRIETVYEGAELADALMDENLVKKINVSSDFFDPVFGLNFTWG